MKNCNACHVHVTMPHRHFCPLCGAELQETAVSEPFVAPNNYPNLRGQIRQYNFIKRLILFVTLLACAISVLVNWLVTPTMWWSVIVLLVSVYCWVTIPPLLRRGANYATRTVWQALFTSALVIVLDFYTGYRGWSVSFVIPSLLSAGILAIGLMAIFNRTNWTQYMFSEIWMAVFAFVPLILYLADIAQNLVMVLVPAGLGIASILAMIVFGDKSLKNEFRRRFNI